MVKFFAPRNQLRMGTLIARADNDPWISLTSKKRRFSRSFSPRKFRARHFQNLQTVASSPNATTQRSRNEKCNFPQRKRARRDRRFFLEFFAPAELSLRAINMEKFTGDRRIASAVLPGDAMRGANHGVAESCGFAASLRIGGCTRRVRNADNLCK